MKRDNVCKRHVAMNTGVKQTESTIFSTLFQWDLNCNCFQVHFERNYAKIVSKF